MEILNIIKSDVYLGQTNKLGENLSSLTESVEKSINNTRHRPYSAPSYDEHYLLENQVRIELPNLDSEIIITLTEIGRDSKWNDFGAGRDYEPAGSSSYRNTVGVDVKVNRRGELAGSFYAGSYTNSLKYKIEEYYKINELIKRKKYDKIASASYDSNVAKENRDKRAKLKNDILDNFFNIETRYQNWSTVIDIDNVIEGLVAYNYMRAHLSDLVLGDIDPAELNNKSTEELVELENKRKEILKDFSDLINKACQGGVDFQAKIDEMFGPNKINLKETAQENIDLALKQKEEATKKENARLKAIEAEKQAKQERIEKVKAGFAKLVSPVTTLAKAASNKIKLIKDEKQKKKEEQARIKREEEQAREEEQRRADLIEEIVNA